MPTTKELIQKLLQKAQIQFDGEITDEIPDDVATQLDNSLLTLQAATNNHPAVKKVYFAQAYNGLDAELDGLADEFGFDDSIKSQLKSEQSSTKRAVALARKIKELSEKQDKTPDAGKAAALQNQILELSNKLRAEQEAKNQIRAEYEKKIQGIRIDSSLKSILGEYKTVYDDLGSDVKETALRSLLEKALQDSDAEFTLDEKGQVSLIKKDGTNLFGDNHVVMTPKSFLDKTMSKILKVSEPAPTPSNNQKPGGPVIPQNPVNSDLAAKIAESRKAYEQSVAGS